MSHPKETPDQTIARLTAENAALARQVAAFHAAQAQAGADEIIIQQKMSRGLSRDQAVAVIKRQRQHDAAEAAKSPA